MFSIEHELFVTGTLNIDFNRVLGTQSLLTFWSQLISRNNFVNTSPAKGLLSAWLRIFGSMILMMFGERLDLCFSFCPDGWQAVGRERWTMLKEVSLDWKKEEKESLAGQSSPCYQGCSERPSSSAEKKLAVQEGPEWLPSTRKVAGNAFVNGAPKNNLKNGRGVCSYMLALDMPHVSCRQSVLCIPGC